MGNDSYAETIEKMLEMRRGGHQDKLGPVVFIQHYSFAIGPLFDIVVGFLELVVQFFHWACVYEMIGFSVIFLLLFGCIMFYQC